MAAAKLGERKPMRLMIPAVFLLALPAAAHADPVQEARSATGACLSAIIENAPVEDIDGDDVTIRRGHDPVSCTVRVTAGEPVLIRDAVLVAMKRRSEIFSAARTRWEPGAWASRETFCNIPGRRALAVFVSTNKPGQQPVLTATVFEAQRRDQRCDRDAGVQTVAAGEPAPPAAAPSAEAPGAPEPATVQTAQKPAKKKGWLPRLPRLGRRD